MKYIIKFGYGVGHVWNDLCAAIWFTYFLVFYTLILEFSSYNSGVLLLIGQIADAAATPIIGYYCDRGPLIFKVINLRRRKLWYLSGSLVAFTTFPFIFLECFCFGITNVHIKVAYYSVFITIFQIAWASVQIAHLSICTDITFIESERMTLMSYRNTFTVSSNLFVYLLTYILLQFVSDQNELHKHLGPKDIGHFQIVVWCALGLGILMSTFFYATIEENLTRLSGIQSEINKEPTTYKELFRRVSLYQLTFMYMGIRVLLNVTQSLFPLYLQLSLSMDKPSVAQLPFVMYISSFTASLLSGIIYRRCGYKITFIIGSSLSIFPAVWIFFDISEIFKTYIVYLITILLGFSSSLLLVTCLAIVADYIGDDINNSGIVYSVLSLVDKLACGLVIMIIQGVGEYFDAVYYYKNILCIVCSGSTGIALICVVTLRKSELARGTSGSSNIE